jgi:hypothetical protein
MMRIMEVRSSLDAGNRKFLLDSGVIGEVIKYGSTWVRYRTPFMKGSFLSVSMKTFAGGAVEVHTEKSPDSASGQ